MDRNEFISDVARYKKKKDSDKSKSNKKSRHKHLYKEVLIESTVGTPGKERIHYSLGRVCEICGICKIDNYFITKRTGAMAYLVLDPDEVREMYKHLDIVKEHED